MARPIKDGLAYFPLDTNFFAQRSVRALRGRFGTDGVAAYLYILCDIYGNDGYYINIDDDFLDAAVCDLGFNINTLRQIIKFLVDRSLLKHILVGTDNFYTSEAIQNTYQIAKKGTKRGIRVNGEIWLLDKSDTASYIEVESPPDCQKGFFGEKLFKQDGFSVENAAEKGGFLPKNSQIKEKKIKEKEIKEEAEAEKAAPKGGSASAALKNIVSAMVKSGSRDTTTLREAIGIWLDNHSEEVILYAIAEADSSGTVNRKYVGAILDRYARDKLDTVEAVRADAERHRQRVSGKGFSDKDSSVYKSGGTDYSDFERRMNAKY